MHTCRVGTGTQPRRCRGEEVNTEEGRERRGSVDPSGAEEAELEVEEETGQG